MQLLPHQVKALSRNTLNDPPKMVHRSTERNQSLDDLHDYASGNDLKRALGHPELQRERELPKAPADTQQAESEGEK